MADCAERGGIRSVAGGGGGINCRGSEILEAAKWQVPRWRAPRNDYEEQLLCGDFFFPRGVVRFHVPVENVDELGDDPVAFQRGKEAAVDVNRGLRFLERPGQRDAQVGMLRFARAVDHAAHDGDFHLFHTGVAALPQRHLFAKVGLDLLCHFLEERAGGTPAPRTCRYLRGETADTERLQDLLRDAYFFRAVATRRWC